MQANYSLVESPGEPGIGNDLGVLVAHKISKRMGQGKRGSGTSFPVLLVDSAAH